MISSAQRTLSRVRGRFASSFMAIMATDKVFGIEARINEDRDQGSGVRGQGSGIRYQRSGPEGLRKQGTGRPT
jgi:hypothetical protein